MPCLGEIATRVAATLGCANTFAVKAVAATLEAIAEGMAAGLEVKLGQFGAFKLWEVKEHYTRLPTGKMAHIRAWRRPRFIPHKGLLGKLNPNRPALGNRTKQ